MIILINIGIVIIIVITVMRLQSLYIHRHRHAWNPTNFVNHNDDSAKNCEQSQKSKNKYGIPKANNEQNIGHMRNRTN